MVFSEISIWSFGALRGLAFHKIIQLIFCIQELFFFFFKLG